MKVMNNISSPKDGVIQDILIEDAQPVEYDQPLVLIKWEMIIGFLKKYLLQTEVMLL